MFDQHDLANLIRVELDETNIECNLCRSCGENYAHGETCVECLHHMEDIEDAVSSTDNNCDVGC